MAGFIQSSIEAENITDAMFEDSSFSRELWMELAEKLHMGLLLDEACDLFSSNINDARFVADQFEVLSGHIRQRHESLAK